MVTRSIEAVHRAHWKTRRNRSGDREHPIVTRRSTALFLASVVALP